MPTKEKQNNNPTAWFHDEDRAQTSIDLLLAITIFFSAVALVTVQVPGLFYPDGLATDDQSTTANQIGIELTNTALSEPGQPSGLSHPAVVSFLEGDDPLEETVNVPDDRSVQVTLLTPTDNPPTALDPEIAGETTSEGQYEYGVDQISKDGEEWYSVEVDEDSPNSPTSTYRIPASLDSQTVMVEVTIGGGS